MYLAEHAVLKTRRAVKFLSAQRTQNPLLVQRFVHEARAAARLQHRNLIQVHDIGQLASGAWFMVLDYLDGQTLSRLMRGRAAPLPLAVVIHIVSEIANGLELAHQHGIIHREVTPENVFLTVRDSDPHHAVLLDLGVAQLGEDPVIGCGARGGAAGAPAYMPQEQLRGAVITPAADIFALGVIAYQLCTGGWFPYQAGESPRAYCKLGRAELVHRQRTRRPIDPRERWPAVGRAWAEVVLAAVSPDPSHRPATAGAFALALAEAVPATPISPSGLDIVRAYARELIDPIDSEAAFEALYRQWQTGGLATATPSPAPASPVVSAPAAARAPLATGSRYQIGDRLGAGGMAEVFTGTMIGAEGFARRVAIKRVLAGLSQAPAFAAMFVTEAQIASRLSHPNIVSVLDFNRDPEDRLFLVMEYVDGKDLASVLAAGPITPSLTIFILVEMLRGLGYAHELPDPVRGVRGVVHRDVSPQNLLLSHEGAVKVSDFGLAKVRAASGAVWSETVRGKPGYMSPEQCAGELLDGRTDLYSVGVMLWEMLAHRPLFVGTANEILAQVMFKDIAPPASPRGRVPADLAAIAMKLLARDRRTRYPTAEAAIEALLSCGDAPRDGRGELVNLLAERFPRATDSRQRMAPPAASPVSRPGPITVSDPSSAVAEQGDGPAFAAPGRRRGRRGLVAAAVSAVVLGCVTAAVIADGAAAPGSPSGRAPVAAPRVAAEPAQIAPVDAGVAAGAPIDAAAPRSPSLAAAPPTGGDAGPVRPTAGAPPHRGPERVSRTGELAIIVQPWAMIWLNGKPSGQTPFRGPVPAGRYRIRLANDDVGRDETTTVTVEPDRTATLERSW
jgi:serine/threonine-protein kinase